MNTKIFQNSVDAVQGINKYRFHPLPVSFHHKNGYILTYKFLVIPKQFCIQYSITNKISKSIITTET